MINMKMKNFKLFAEQIEFLKANFPAELEKFLLDISAGVLRSVTKRTPTDEGDLKKSWKITDVVRDGDNLLIYVYSSEFYAPFVEFGHQIVVHDKVIGKVTGNYMLTASIKAMNKQVPRRLRKIFADLVANS